MVELENFEVAEDMMIDGLKVVQDTRLYRFTSDSVLLSRFAGAKNGEIAADFCSGCGIVGFHFYALNKPKIKSVTLFEMQESLHKLALKTVALNNFDVFTCENVRLQDIPPKYVENFSLVLCNPPYERAGTGFDNAEYEKAICRKELTLTLEEIAASAAKCLQYGGRLCMVHRADRLAEICYILKSHGIEVKRLQFVAGREGAKPYLLLVEGVKGGKPATEILPTIINQR
jgi:tRNA1(Val) A37 N6-methylase TrmN6